MTSLGAPNVLVCSPAAAHMAREHAEAEQGMKGMKARRGPSRSRDAAAVSGGSSEPHDPGLVGEASDQAPKTDEVPFFSSFGSDQIRLYQAEVARRAAALRQSPEPWLSAGAENPSFLEEEQGRSTAADGGSPPTAPPSDGHAPGASSPVPSYRIVTYDKPTEQRKGYLPIPPSVLEQIKGIVDFGLNIDDLRKYHLDEAQTRQIAGLLSFNPEPDHFFYYIEPNELHDERPLDTSAEQRPAAYRFELRGRQIDVLPERPEAVDAELALDTYRELLAKAQALHGRLIQSNSARRVCGSVEMLLEALGSHFDDLRPGVLLSRERSIAADRAAFDTADGRGELFADAFAMLDDTLQTLRDLLAAFPIVRRIEAERLALDLDRSADALPIIQEQMAVIEATAEKSGAVTDRTIVALTQNDVAIEDAIDPVVQRSLVADKLLVFRNFAGAVIGGAVSCGRGALAKAGTELAGLSGEVWKEVRARLPGAVGLTVTVAPLLLLADQIGDPYLRIGAAVPALAPIASILKKAIADTLRKGTANSLKDAVAGDAKGKKDKPKAKKS